MASKSLGHDSSVKLLVCGRAVLIQGASFLVDWIRPGQDFIIAMGQLHGGPGRDGPSFSNSGGPWAGLQCQRARAGPGLKIVARAGLYAGLCKMRVKFEN